jgi:UDP-N-acetylmuramoylalanine--D-glutamate ligase
VEKFADKNISVFGLARSGIAAAKKLVSLGARVMVSEIRPVSEIDAEVIKEIQGLKIDLEAGGHSSRSIESAELIVVSPGVHLDLPVLERAKEKGIPIISEIELAYRLLSRPMIAVTGTNGKTTTTALIGELLKASGKRVAVAGNIGSPLVGVDDSKLDYIVAEISSYQLESIDRFKPWISVILNIQPDHLERHGSMPEYIAQKSRIFTNQGRGDHIVYNMDDPEVARMVKKSRAKLIGFSKEHPEILALSPAQIKIPGKHNLENSLAAAQAAYLCKVKKEIVAEVLKSFPGVEHRIEFVSKINGIEFYNDSKATNPDSTLVALETFKGRGVILILGGRDKGVGLDALCKKVKEEVKAVVLMGKATGRFDEALKQSGYKNIHLASSMDEAVRSASALGNSGDIVLLSPACASFDMFADFEERGRVFKEAVRQLDHA